MKIRISAIAVFFLSVLFLGITNATFASSITGLVREAESRAAIADANVSFPALARTIKTDDQGEFSLEVGQPGTYRIKISHVAFEPSVMDIELGADDVSIEVLLQRRTYLSDEVVVTATRTPYLLKNVPVTTDVIRIEEAQNAGAITVNEALETMTGINVDEDFSGAGVSLRGLDPTRVLVLVDGERVVGRVRGAIDVSQLSLDNVEKIEVVKGTSSTLYGSDAIGGVVNVITRRPSDRLRVSTFTDYGTYNTFSQLIEAETKRGRWGLQAGGKFYRTDGFDLMPETPHTNGLERIRKFNFNGKLTGHFSPALQGGFTGSFFTENKKWLESESLPPRVYVFDDEENNYRYSGRLKLSYNPQPQTFADINIYGTYYDHLWEKFADRQKIDDSRTEDFLWEASVLASHTCSDGHVITMGGDWAAQSLTAPTVKDTVQKINNGDLYATYEWKPWPHLVILPGVRLESNSAYGEHLTGSVNVMETPHPRLRLRASYGGGFRAPTIKELYFRFDHSAAGYLIEGGEDDLQPETSRNSSLTVEYSYGGIGLHRLTYFYNHLENLIEFDKVDESPTYWRGIYQYRNVFRAYTRGIEWQSQVKPTADTDFLLSYTWLTAKDLQTSNWLLGRPEHSLTLKGSLDVPGWGSTITAWGNWYSRKLWTPRGDQNNFESDEWAPSRRTINVSVTQRLAGGFELFARAENLTDDIKAYYGYWPGRMFFAGIRFNKQETNHD